MDTPFIGQIALFPYNFAPNWWAACNGQIPPINENEPLYALSGTNFGGDEQTTFALPDRMGKHLLTISPII